MPRLRRFLLVVPLLVGACAVAAHAAPDVPPPPPPPRWGGDVVVAAPPPAPAAPVVVVPAAPVMAVPPCAPCVAPCAPCETCPTAATCPPKPFNLDPCTTIRLGAFLSIQKGNSDTLDVKLDGEIEHKPNPWGYRAALAYVYGEDAGTTSSDEWHGLARLERKISGRASVFAEVLYDRDDLAGLEYRFTGTLGLGYAFIEEPCLLLKGEIGAGGVLEKYDTREETFDPSAYLGLRFEKKWGEDGTRLFADLKFLPNLSDFDLSRLVLDSGYEMPLCAWLKAALGLRIEYQVEPPDPAIEETDLLFTVGLKAVF